MPPASSDGRPAAPESEHPYTIQLRSRTVRWTTGVVAVSNVVLAVVFALFDGVPWHSGLLLAVSIAGIPIASVARRRPVAAAIALYVLVVVTITALIVVDQGFRDPGMAAYPLLVVMGVVLFGPRTALWLSAVFAAVGVWIASRTGVEDPEIAVSPNSIATHLALLLSAAVLARVIVMNIRRHLAEVERADRELRDAYEKTLIGWSRVLELKDEETEGHSRRVAALAELLARQIGLDEDEVEHIRRGALLHDIGKLAVPDGILRKAGPLTTDEFAVMRQHPTAAGRMIADIAFLAPALSIPVHHHERWDGTGYPDRLAGEAIPLAARLFAVVDQWEALTSDRPYRRAWEVERANAHLREQAGSGLDPAMVDAFLSIEPSRLKAVLNQ
jgi:putative nucleotidyltransferase with HDIG domain